MAQKTVTGRPRQENATFATDQEDFMDVTHMYTHEHAHVDLFSDNFTKLERNTIVQSSETIEHHAVIVQQPFDDYFLRRLNRNFSIIMTDTVLVRRERRLQRQREQARAHRASEMTEHKEERSFKISSEYVTMSDK